MRNVSSFIFFFILLTFFSYADVNPNNNEQIIQKTKTLYLQLMNFKDKSDFHAFGFGAGGPYNKWLEEIEKLESNPNANLLLLREGLVVGDLKMLGLEYVNSKGKETEYTRFIVPEIKKALRIEKSEKGN